MIISYLLSLPSGLSRGVKALELARRYRGATLPLLMNFKRPYSLSRSAQFSSSLFDVLIANSRMPFYFAIGWRQFWHYKKEQNLSMFKNWLEHSRKLQSEDWGDWRNSFVNCQAPEKAIGNHELQIALKKRRSELLKRDIVFCSSLYL